MKYKTMIEQTKSEKTVEQKLRLQWYLYNQSIRRIREERQKLEATFDRINHLMKLKEREEKNHVD